ncbi:hypothetical protein PR003_g4377 [Phytophthora rubi]|uniref:Uncharacterized protein n=1 Tax=Phytophthora rubi TaxID=129364 RepID=A0A6A4FWZ5_9STRA|nr:hypothetical protein PR002_g4292 [Phytophthora rubi]KAE9047599.1 hypothetical protein PR001_g4153 [Phytophthora rubi]KAE9352464.1 hypothetical protein PR003_g4377 [Phytophthora rubi]
MLVNAQLAQQSVKLYSDSYQVEDVNADDPDVTPAAL